MSLTPEEIAGKEFTFGLRGYDPEEVRAFLQLVATLVETAGDAPAGAAGADVSQAQAARAAALVLEHAHTEADEIRQSAGAEAEMTRARARAILAAAQDEALRLVAETHARIDRRFGGGPDASGDDGRSSTVEQLGQEISAMVQARNDVLHQLHEVKERLDLAVTSAEADPVLRRKALEAG